MPCNPFAPDFLDCLAQEQANETKKKLAEAILAGAVVVITNSRIEHLETEYNINDLPSNVKTVAIQMRNEGMFAWSNQQLQEWLDNQP